MLVGIMAVLVLAVAAPALATRTPGQGGRGGGPIVYVTGQDLFFDSIIVADPVPNKGQFQELEMAGPSPNGLQTEFGPGDTGYLGGRWWVDVNEDGEKDDGDVYFICPLLGPGFDRP